MKYKVVIPEIAVIVHLSEKVNRKNYNRVAKMAVEKARAGIGYLMPVQRKPEYLSRGNWRVFCQDIVLGTIEADSPEEAIDKMGERYGFLEENFKAIPFKEIR